MEKQLLSSDQTQQRQRVKQGINGGHPFLLQLMSTGSSSISLISKILTSKDLLSIHSSIIHIFQVFIVPYTLQYTVGKRQLSTVRHVTTAAPATARAQGPTFLPSFFEILPNNATISATRVRVYFIPPATLPYKYSPVACFKHVLRIVTLHFTRNHQHQTAFFSRTCRFYRHILPTWQIPQRHHSPRMHRCTTCPP
jgi:hypothetical protein